MYSETFMSNNKSLLSITCQILRRIYRRDYKSEWPLSLAKWEVASQCSTERYICEQTCDDILNRVYLALNGYQALFETVVHLFSLHNNI